MQYIHMYDFGKTSLYDLHTLGFVQKYSMQVKYDFNYV